METQLTDKLIQIIEKSRPESKTENQFNKILNQEADFYLQILKNNNPPTYNKDSTLQLNNKDLENNKTNYLIFISNQKSTDEKLNGTLYGLEIKLTQVNEDLKILNSQKYLIVNNELFKSTFNFYDLDKIKQNYIFPKNK